MVEAADFYLPDDLWEHVLQFLNNDDDDCHYLKSLSVVSKQLLSLTNRHKLSLRVVKQTHPFLHRLFRRFPYLTSLNLMYFKGDKDALLSQIACFRLKVTSLKLSGKIPTNGLQAFSKKITTLTSLTCSNINCGSNDLFLIADCFPNLQQLDFTYCYDVSEESIYHVLRTCLKITHLNLDGCYYVKLLGLNFEIPKLEVLNLSNTVIHCPTLDVISKSFPGLLELILEHCPAISKKGVECVVEKCTQLREINLKECPLVATDIVASISLSRPSLRMITTPFSEYDKIFGWRRWY